MNPLADPRTENLKLTYEVKDRAAKDAWSAFQRRKQELEHKGADLVNDKANFNALKELHATYEQAADAAAEARTAYLKHLEGRSGIGVKREVLPGSMPDNLSKSFIEGLGAKAVDATSGGTATSQFYDPRIRELPARALFVRSVIPTVAVDTDKVDYLRQTVATNNAAPVAAGALKPTSVYSIERVEASVTTVAHLSEPVDRALLLDMDNLSDWLDNQLRLGVLLAEENQILNGNGTPPNLRGILNTAGILTQARGTDSHADAVFKALVKLRNQTNPFEANAIVLNPADYQTLRLAKDANGAYMLGAMTEGDEDRLFGKEVIQSGVIAQGTGLVGDFNQATVWDREQARVTFAESGGLGAGGVEIFARNQIVFRGEERIAFGVLRPAAFCTVTGL